MGTFSYHPSSKEAAVLLLKLISSRESEGKTVSRLRVSEQTLKRIFNCARLKPAFLDEVAEWLLEAGWVLLFARSNYGLVKATIVDGWPRISSKRIADDLVEVRRGAYDFEKEMQMYDIEHAAGAALETDED